MCAVLASESFRRCPTVAQLLNYICERYFEGEAETIKEYNIAVEGLGRPPDFDQKKDSIVRVEAHRLRRRLKEYYETEGRGHRIRVELPLGGYVPVFHRVEAEPREAESTPRVSGAGEVGGAPPEPRVAPSGGRSRPHRRLWAAVAAALLLMVVSAALFLRPDALQQLAAEKAPPQPVNLSSAATVGEIRIAASRRSGEGASRPRSRAIPIRSATFRCARSWICACTA